MSNIISFPKQMATPREAWPKRVYRARKRADLLETATTIAGIAFALCCLWFGAVLVMSLGG